LRNASLLVYARDQLNSKLPPGLRSRVDIVEIDLLRGGFWTLPNRAMLKPEIPSSVGAAWKQGMLALWGFLIFGRSSHS